MGVRMSASKLILGSASPRRLELVGLLGLEPSEIRKPEIDETPHFDEKPRDYVRRMAFEKANALPCAPGEIILCADTSVAVGRRILGKPADQAEAEVFLRLMSGRRHRVITAIAVKTTQALRLKDVVSTVRMKVLSDHEINGYLTSGDWRGKAGGYGIQGPASAFIPWIEGSYHAIMGLPMVETANLLQAAGLKIWSDRS